MKVIEIDIEYAKSIFEYNPKTGIFTRTVATNKKVKVGDIAGRTKSDGYIKVCMRGVWLLAHRLAWAMYYNEQPPLEIDHINRNPSDNRILNLRKCTGSQNQANRVASKNNTSGFKGVSWHKASKKWHAQTSKGRKRINLGLHINLEAAANAYAEGVKIHHGEFANFTGATK